MPLEDIVDVSITATAAPPSAPGFGVALIACFKVPPGFTNRVQSYNSLKEMSSAGWLVTDPGYKAANVYFSQSPRPKKVKIGRRATGPTQILKLTVLSAAPGEVIKVDVKGAASTAFNTLTFTAGSSETTTTAATALELLIEAVTGVQSTSSGAVITFGPDAGGLVDVANWTNNLAFAETTTDPGLQTDLNAIEAEDEDWYGLLLDSNSPAEVAQAAAWTESREKLFGYNIADTAASDSVITTDTFSVLKAATYMRSVGLWDKNQLLGYSMAGLFGNRFVVDPGSDTWKFKSIATVTVDVMTSAQRNAVLNKNGNTYTQVASKNIVEEGKVASGEWVDVIRFIDWLRAQLRVAVFNLLVSVPKVPFTDEGIESVVNVVKGVLSAGVAVGGLAPGEFTVSAPTALEVDAATRAARILPNVNFTARLAGAIHVVQITGTVSS